jgi:hypothetical protein
MEPAANRYGAAIKAAQKGVADIELESAEEDQNRATPAILARRGHPVDIFSA